MALSDAVHFAKFLATHTYSKAPEAFKKQTIDGQILAQDFSKASNINIADEGYLKELIKLAAAGTRSVSSGAAGLQFFIVKGGAEGFLDSSYAGTDASRVIETGPTTSGKLGTTMIFDDNDLLIAFDKAGKFLDAALLRRPISITNPNIWTEHTANLIYDAWDKRPVSLYRNANFDVTYYGLWIDDSRGWYRSGKVRVDLHKQEATNGCVFILDPGGSPDYDPAHLGPLNSFEPHFIKKIQSTVGAKIKSNIGTMNIIEIK